MAETLSKREFEVLQRLSEGFSNAEIAKDLTLSTETIKTYIRNLLWKLAVKNRTHAVAYALRTGLIQ